MLPSLEPSNDADYVGVCQSEISQKQIKSIKVYWYNFRNNNNNNNNNNNKSSIDAIIKVTNYLFIYFLGL